MNAIDHTRWAPSLRLVVAAVLVVLVGCGRGEAATVPGVAALSEVAIDPAADEAEAFTPAPPTVVKVGSTSTTSTSTTSTSTTSTTSTSTTSLPTRSDVRNSSRAPVRPSPLPVIIQVTGWPAFDLHLQSVLAGGSSAVSATVLRDGEIVHEVALGARTAAGGAVNPGDRFRVASISKVITSVTVLRLVQAGQLSLDAPIGERLATRVGAAPSSGVSAITPRHLLTHRSGIAQYESLVFERQVESCEHAAATGLSRPLERAPGTTLRYSNLNFCLLGLLIEDVTGRPYADVASDELLRPLGIEGMRLAGTFDVRDGDVEHRSDVGRNYMEVLGAAGSWIASPTDVARIIDALDPTTPGWKPLERELLAEMTTITADPAALEAGATTTTVLPPTRGYGMGLMIFGPETFGHTGTLESTHAMTTRRPDGYTWAITVSGDHPSSSRDLAGIVETGLRYAGVLDS